MSRSRFIALVLRPSRGASDTGAAGSSNVLSCEGEEIGASSCLLFYLACPVSYSSVMGVGGAWADAARRPLLTRKHLRVTYVLSFCPSMAYTSMSLGISCTGAAVVTAEAVNSVAHFGSRDLTMARSTMYDHETFGGGSETGPALGTAVKFVVTSDKSDVGTNETNSLHGHAFVTASSARPPTTRSRGIGRP